MTVLRGSKGRVATALVLAALVPSCARAPGRAPPAVSVGAARASHVVPALSVGAARASHVVPALSAGAARASHVVPPALSAGATRAVHPSSPASAPLAGGTAVVGRPSGADLSDPLSVARAVITWLLCGTGPPSVVSPHGQQVLDRWSALAQPGAGFTITELAFVDPRASPVTVVARIQRHDGPLDVVLTLFRRPTGAWFVDDLALGP